MIGIFENIKRNQFVKNVFVLASGTIIVQLISILISPILSRLYTPQDYGLFAVFTSCAGILIVIVCFRYELSILIPGKNDEAKLLLKLSLIITALFSLIILLVTLIFNQEIASLLGSEKLNFWLYFIGPVILAAGVTQSFTYWYNRNKNYKIISGVRVYQSSFYSGFSLIFGIFKLNSFGLILSFIISQLLSAIYFFKKSAVKLSSISFDYSKLKAVARKYIEFPLYNMPSALLDTFSINSIILLLNYFFSDAVTGAYAFSLRILSIPGVVVGAAVGQVFFQKISEAYNNNERIFGLIFNTWKVLFLIGIIPTFVLFFFSEELFTYIFGKNWAEAGVISRYLCILTFFSFISSPTSGAMIVLRKQRAVLILNIIAFIYRPLALLWGHFTNNFLNGIILYIILEILQIFSYNIIMLRGAKEVDLVDKHEGAKM